MQLIILSRSVYWINHLHSPFPKQVTEWLLKARRFRKWIVKVVVQQVALINKVCTGVLSIEREKGKGERDGEHSYKNT